MKRAAVFLNGAVKNDSRVLKTINTLAKKFTVDVFYVNGDEDDFQLFEGNVVLHSIPYKIINLRQKIIRHTLFYMEFDFLNTLACQQEKKYHLVWANDLPTCRPALKIARKWNATFVYDSHEIYIETINQFFLEQPNKIKKLVFKFLIWFMRFAGFHFEKKIMKKIHLLVTVNESLQKYFVEKYSIPIDKTTFIMNCPNISTGENEENEKTKLLFPKDSKIIIYQGVLNEGRGLLTFLEVMKTLPNKFVWIILGEGILKQQINRFILENNLTDTVFCLGKVDEKSLDSYTKQAHIGLNLLEPINLSKKMASPNKLFQYVHSGIPSLCTDTVENRKVISQFNVGRLTSNSIKDLSHNIQALAEVSIDIREFNKAKELYSWKNQEAKLWQELNKLTYN